MHPCVPMLHNCEASRAAHQSCCPGLLDLVHLHHRVVPSRPVISLARCIALPDRWSSFALPPRRKDVFEVTLNVEAAPMQTSLCLQDTVLWGNNNDVSLFGPASQVRHSKYPSMMQSPDWRSPLHLDLRISSITIGDALARVRCGPVSRQLPRTASPKILPSASTTPYAMRDAGVHRPASGECGAADTNGAATGAAARARQ